MELTDVVKALLLNTVKVLLAPLPMEAMDALDALESQLQRLPHLEKWFVDIGYPSPAIQDN
jgi:hypothetical protein